MKVARIAVLVLFSVASSLHVSADMKCVYGLSVYSPTTGEFADCLEDGGNDCMACEVIDKTP